MDWRLAIILLLIWDLGNERRSGFDQWRCEWLNHPLGKNSRAIQKIPKDFVAIPSIIAINRFAIHLGFDAALVCRHVAPTLGFWNVAQSGLLGDRISGYKDARVRRQQSFLRQIRVPSLYKETLDHSFSTHSPHHNSSQFHSSFTMEKELEELWGKITLNELEEKQITITGKQTTISNRLVLGRFIGRKSISLQQLTMILKKSWSTPNLKASQVGDNTYLFELPTREACLKVYKDQPWHVGGVLLAVKIVAEQSNFEDMQVTKAPFWVQVHAFQFFNTTEENGKLIAQAARDVIEVDIDKQVIAWGKFMRVRVLVDVDKPLCRWSNPLVNDKHLFVLFRYEKIVEYCFGCGFIDHMLKECLERFNPDGSTKKVAYKYPMWLRAEGVASVSFEDLKRFLETSRYMMDNIEKGKEKLHQEPAIEGPASRLMIEAPAAMTQGSQVGSLESKATGDQAPMDVEKQDAVQAIEQAVSAHKRSRIGGGGVRSGGASNAHGGEGGFAPYKSRKREQVSNFKDLRVTKRRTTCLSPKNPQAKVRKIMPRPEHLSYPPCQMLPAPPYSLASGQQIQLHASQPGGYGDQYGGNHPGMIGPVAAELWGITRQAFGLGPMGWGPGDLSPSNIERGIRIEDMDEAEGWYGPSDQGQSSGIGEAGSNWGMGFGPNN